MDREEPLMTNDDEWVADVRRWCQQGAMVRAEGRPADVAIEDGGLEGQVGYEAAFPVPEPGTSIAAARDLP